MGKNKLSKDVIQYEKTKLGKAAGQSTTGLALSGGGIRSASFGLGVLQALLEHGVLERIDYLSTVSGGGYIGSALTWFRKRHAGKDGKFFDSSNPFGVKHEGARTLQYKNVSNLSGESKEDDNTSQDPQVVIKNTFLSYLRQHSRYLAPNAQLSTLSLVATVLRNLIVSVLVYLSMLVVLLSFLGGVSHLACGLPGIEQLAGIISKLDGKEEPKSPIITIACPEGGGDCTVVSREPSELPTVTAWGDHTLFQSSALVAVAAIILIIGRAIFIPWPQK